jgi:hypothetical protein
VLNTSILGHMLHDGVLYKMRITCLYYSQKDRCLWLKIDVGCISCTTLCSSRILYLFFLKENIFFDTKENIKTYRSLEKRKHNPCFFDASNGESSDLPLSYIWRLSQSPCNPTTPLTLTPPWCRLSPTTNKLKPDLQLKIYQISYSLCAQVMMHKPCLCTVHKTPKIA